MSCNGLSDSRFRVTAENIKSIRFKLWLNKNTSKRSSMRGKDRPRRNVSQDRLHSNQIGMWLQGRSELIRKQVKGSSISESKYLREKSRDSMGNAVVSVWFCWVISDIECHWLKSPNSLRTGERPGYVTV